MIWLYILISIILSYFFCRKECKRPEYYILILFPIEMYGLNVGSATIKLYMFVGTIIAIYFIIMRKAKIRPVILLVTFLLILSDIFTGLEFPSVKQHMMFLLNMIIAFCILDISDDSTDLKALASVAIATVIGHGIVFAMCTAMLRVNSNFPDILAYNRTETGIFLRLMSGTIEEIRMRGFAIDPNGFVVNYLLGGGCAIYYAFTERLNRFKNIIAIILFAFIVIASGSRTAMICLLVMLVLGFLYATKTNGMSRGGVIIFGLFFTIGIFLLTFNFNLLSSAFNTFFIRRAALSSDAGRFTIWTSNMDYLIRTNKIWLGVGQGQISIVGNLGHAFHNTWLEWVAGCGIVIGGMIDMMMI